MSSRPIAEGLFTEPGDEPRLIGNRCRACAAITFPVRVGCARCGAGELERYLLADRGTLWAWTTQGFLPKAPFAGTLTVGPDTVPWFVGVVELPGELRVESLLVGVTEETLGIGMPLRLALVPFRHDEDGTEVVTFAFTPDGGAEPENEREAEKIHA
ncbi:Zn-ribbon domain-containing OB-fold protein [Streptomyces sp. NPDC057363]|uniref:Zn-ribbon domain-containing OB-fold protein n=1 Tax=Streptomyces sp. NPDC057363 TaxID=3346107 RepID=UPI00362572BC